MPDQYDHMMGLVENVTCLIEGAESQGCKVTTETKNAMQQARGVIREVTAGKRKKDMDLWWTLLGVGMVLFVAWAAVSHLGQPRQGPPQNTGWPGYWPPPPR